MSKGPRMQNPFERFKTKTAEARAPRNYGNPWIYVAVGVVFIAVGAWLRFGDDRHRGKRGTEQHSE